MLGFSSALVLAATVVGAPTPLRLPADVSDVYALDANPAGLAYLEGAELRLLYARDDLDPDAGRAGPVDGFGIYGGLGEIGPLSFGAALDVDVDDADRTGFRLVFGSALRLGSFGLGWTVDRVRRPGGEAKTRFHAGFTQRWTSWLATGLSIRDVAQTLDRRRWDIGLALRPFDRLVVSGRWRLTQSQPAFDADTLDLTGLVSVEPFDGLRLGVGVQHAPGLDLAVTTQLEIGFGHAAVGAAALAVNERPAVVAEVAAFSRAEPAIYTPSAVAVIDIAGALKPDPSLSLLRRKLSVAPYGDLPLLLELLGRSDRVEGVFARIGPISAGWAKAQEVRAGLLRLREAGLRVDCQLGGANDLAYFVATGCQSIIVPPPSVLRVDGVASTQLFLGEAIDALGIDVEVVKRGAYKSAPDQLTRGGMSPAQREALSAYLDDVYGALVDGIAEGRALDAEKVRGLLDLGTHTASQALERGLVDHALYPDEIEPHLNKTYQRRLSFIPAEEAARPARPRWGPRPRIAIVYVDAAITGGESEDLPFGLGQSVGARTLGRALEALRTDTSVRAVVLRIDSPGGDSLASDLIARAVERLAKEKPVIASLGDVAASGGYYVAAPATTIYAEPTTLTGSIGVFSLSLSGARLLSRLGIGVEQIERGRFSGGGSPFLPWTDPEREKVSEVIDHFYEQFLETVARGRDMERDEVHAVAQGRIWSGEDAKAKGLVDEIGGFTAALARAKREAGLGPDDAVDLVVRPRNRRPLSKAVRSVVQSIAGEPEASAADLVGALVPAPVLRGLAPWLVGPRPEAAALLPFVLDID